MGLSKSEDILGEKWDACISDTLRKMGGGFALGAVFSLVLFKRKAWPIIFGIGAGTGMGYSNCQHLLDQPYLIKADKLMIKPKDVTSSAPVNA